MDITEVQIQRYEYAILLSTATRYHSIVDSCQAFIHYCIGFEASVAEKNHTVSRQVPVDLQFQSVCSKGRSAVPSRASSAAYSRAA